MKKILVNGVLGASVPADDPGLLLGLTVFETQRTYNGVPFRLSRHLDRLAVSADQMQIELPSRDAIEARIHHALDGLSKEDDYYLRYTMTAGRQEIVEIQTIEESRVGRPVHVGKLHWDPPDWLPGVVKHGSRASWIVAAQQQAVEEVLLVDKDGFILEANRSNIFVVQNGVWCTPELDDRFLEGITRGALLEAASDVGIPVKEWPISFDGSYDEMYLSSTLKELAPIATICGKPAPGGGPVGKAIHQAFRALITRETQGN
jgi:branched-subunit amino acid aminotransferase/4-amino-4-deoxychorismate lyase